MNNSTFPNYSISNFHEFANLLHEKLHTLLNHYENLQEIFTLVTNLIDRSPENLEKNILLYAGVKSQRRILESYNQINEKRKKALEKNWNQLENKDIGHNTEQIKTFDFLSKYKSGELSIKDIQLGYLSDYFSKIKNEIQINEHAILKENFCISSDLYISIPIIAFGTIDGVVHIIFKAADLNKFTEREGSSILNYKVIGRIIKYFTHSYEEMLLAWEMSGKNIIKTSENISKKLNIDTSYVQNNPILKQLGFDKYYDVSNNYFEKKKQRADLIPRRFSELETKLKNAKEELKQRLQSEPDLHAIWEMPNELTTCFHQFLVYFSKFTNIFHQKNFHLKVQKSEKGLKLTIPDNYSYEDVKKLDSLLLEYISLFFNENMRSFKERIINKDIDIDETSMQFHIEELVREQLVFQNKIFKIHEYLDTSQKANSPSLKVNINYFFHPSQYHIQFNRLSNGLETSLNQGTNQQLIGTKLAQETRKLIESNQTRQCFSLLEHYYEKNNNQEKRNILSILKAMYNRIKNSRIKKTISNEAFELEHTKIIDRLLDLITDLETLSATIK